MKKFGYKIASALTTASLLTLMTTSSAFAGDVDVVVSGNGSDSNQTVGVVMSSNSSVNQTNNTTVVNDINAVSKTGDNQANGNTGGNVTLTSGNATTGVSTVTGGNSNTATSDPCGCPAGDVTVKVKDNGSGSSQTVEVVLSSSGSVKQKNIGVVVNGITAKAKTNKNKANNNTGGNVTLTSGAAVTSVVVTVNGSSNTLNP